MQLYGENKEDLLCSRLHCIFPSFRVSRLLSHPFKAVFVLHSRSLPYKAAALCSEEPDTQLWLLNEAQIVDYRLPIRGGQDGTSACPLLKPFYRRHISACLFLSCAMQPSFPPFSLPSLSSASQPVMWLPSIHAVRQLCHERSYVFWRWMNEKLTTHNWLRTDISPCSWVFF